MASFYTYKRQVPLTPGQRLGYTRGRGYYATGGPFDPLPEGQLRQQASRTARAQVDPIIAELMRTTDQQARGLEGLTDRYAGRIGAYAPAVDEVYGRAKTETAGIADALANRLAGAGATEAASLREALGKAAAPSRLVDELASGAAATGTGAANAGFARDSAALEALTSRAAGASDYARALPQFARLEGLQAIGDLQRRTGERVGEIRAGIPGLVAELMETGRDRELDKAIAREGFGVDQARIGLGYAEEAGQAARSQMAEQGRNARDAAGRKAAAAKERQQKIDNAFGQAKLIAERGRTRTREESQYGKVVKVPDPAGYADARRQVVEYLRGLLGGVLPNARILELARRALESAGYRHPVPATATGRAYGYPGSGVGGQTGG